MFLDSKIGFLLLLTHFLAALLVGFVFRFYPFSLKNSKKSNTHKNEFFAQKNKVSISRKSYQQDIKQKRTYNNKTSTSLAENKKRIHLSDLGSIMGEGIRNSISTLLLICGFLVFFCVLGTMLDKTGITSGIASFLEEAFIFFGFSEEVAQEIATGSFKGLLEITSGIKLLSSISVDVYTILPLVATILGFGGISVLMQVASIISHTDLSIRPYLLGKILHGIFAGILTYVILNYTNFFQLEALETFSSITVSEINGVTGSGNLLLMTFAGILLVGLMCLLFDKKFIKRA